LSTYQLLPEDGVHLDPAKRYQLTVFTSGDAEGFIRLVNKEPAIEGKASFHWQRILPSPEGEVIPVPLATYKVINEGETVLSVHLTEINVVNE
jgi:hypothetical protein